jgi:cytochrome c-type biogenesis protein CcmE
MKLGPLVTGAVAICAMAAVLGAFATSASPYVTIKEAKTNSGDHLHLAGTLIKDSAHADILKRRLTFRLQDASGDIVLVEHVGEMPSNLTEAKKIVAIGGMKGDRFESSQLIVKCPSRYDPETDGASSTAPTEKK